MSKSVKARTPMWRHDLRPADPVNVGLKLLINVTGKLGEFPEWVMNPRSTEAGKVR